VVVLAAQHLLQELAVVVLVVAEILFQMAQQITELQILAVAAVAAQQFQVTHMLLVQVDLAS
jgi:hypothetical protein